MWFRGNVSFQNGAVFDPSSTTQFLEVQDSSEIIFMIIGIDDRPIKSFPMKHVPYGSLIEGQIITLAFQDKKGRVFLDGRVEGTVFSGELRYENFTTYKGETGHKGTLANFSIYACSFFDCGTSFSPTN